MLTVSLLNLELEFPIYALKKGTGNMLDKISNFGSHCMLLPDLFNLWIHTSIAHPWFGQ